MADVMTFEMALEKSGEFGATRHLLLGNGFSIACRPDAFRYGELLSEADFDALSIDAGPLFELLGTADFEQAIEALRVSAEVLDLYSEAGNQLIERLSADADALKEALADVLARKHPDHVGEIAVEEYERARHFLAHFHSNIYTVNYDLLLYWILMQSLQPEVPSDDGFRSDPEEEDAEWVVWEGFEGNEQRIFYLHGGLHLYDAGSQLQKITWSRTGIPLIDQIRAALAENVYPHVVTEGTSRQKLARIEHSPYLHRGLKSLNRIGGTLFVYGHSLAANDEHVLARIENSKVRALFVSLHGDPGSDDNRAIRSRAELMIGRRDLHEEHKQQRWRNSLEVFFYDATSASVWS